MKNKREKNPIYFLINAIFHHTYILRKKKIEMYMSIFSCLYLRIILHYTISILFQFISPYFTL